MVEISGHDLHRLLLQFREEIERDNRPNSWRHADDYDRSFENLADIVDAWNAEMGHEPDPRIRCNHSNPVYTWPGEITGEWVNIRDTGAPHPQRKGRHIAISDLRGGVCLTLCQLLYAPEDLVKRPVKPYETCQECARELSMRDNVTIGER
jgi:hypothetical protein